MRWIRLAPVTAESLVVCAAVFLGCVFQAMADQAKADTLYDTKPEGFRNETYRSVPWITRTEACKKEGFLVNTPQNKVIIATLIILGVSGILLSFSKKR